MQQGKDSNGNVSIYEVLYVYVFNDKMESIWQESVRNSKILESQHTA